VLLVLPAGTSPSFGQLTGGDELLFSLPRDFSHIPTSTQVENDVFKVMIKDALNKMIGSTNPPASVTVFLSSSGTSKR